MKPNWRRLLGLWYFGIPLISFGYLSGIPVLHAAWRLHDRKLAFTGVAYLVGAILFGLLATSGPSGSQQSLVVSIGALGALTLGLVACWQLFVPYHKVYVLPYQQGYVHSAPRSTSSAGPRATTGFELGFEPLSHSQPTVSMIEQARSRRKEIAKWILAAGYFLMVGASAFYLVFIWPVRAIELTIGEIEAGPIEFNDLISVIYGFILPLPLIVFLLERHKNRDRDTLLVQALCVFAAVVVNILLTISIWFLVTSWTWFELAPVTKSEFGYMVWWNLIDSVPIIDLDAGLDWERPIDEYGERVGCMLLFQRVVLLLTLAWTIQVLIAGILERRSGPRSPGVGDSRGSQQSAPPPVRGPSSSDESGYPFARSSGITYPQATDPPTAPIPVPDVPSNKGKKKRRKH